VSDLGAASTREQVMAEVVGREREIELILVAVEAGRDLVVEGPPGTSKTTLLKAITDAWGIPLILVEGNAELTPGRLLGHHDPARVLTDGYGADTFEPGPLVEAMSSGGFLYLEELNRAPEDTLNVLLSAIADRRIAIPRVGTIEALPSFRLIGSMNPFDNVGTTRLSVSIKDRLNRLTIGYQDAGAEREIVRRRSGEQQVGEIDRRIVADAVALTRATRSHDGIRQGSSVRGAIDLALMAAGLCSTRGIGPEETDAYRDAFWETMAIALSGRISLDHASELDEYALLREIWEDHFILAGQIAEAGGKSIELDEPSVVRREADPRDRAQRSFKAKPKPLDAEPTLSTNGQGPVIAADPDRAGGAARRPGSTSFTDEAGQLDDDEEGEQPGPAPAVRKRAREIAAMLALRPPEPKRRPPRGSGEILGLPYSGAGGELDLDRTMDLLAERRPLESEEIIVRERRRTGREVVLAVDVSGSMSGDRLLTAAATVGALSATLAVGELAVIAFWSDASLLVGLGEAAPSEHLIDALLNLDAKGLTNVAFPLEVAQEQLGGSSTAAEQRVLLLSDCVHNAGPDPREPAAALPRLDLLFDVEGERDSALAADLGRLGRGQVRPIRGYRDVAPALASILESDR
jgi:MoxR-like ATPase